MRRAAWALLAALVLPACFSTNQFVAESSVEQNKHFAPVDGVEPRLSVEVTARDGGSISLRVLQERACLVRTVETLERKQVTTKRPSLGLYPASIAPAVVTVIFPPVALGLLVAGGVVIVGHHMVAGTKSNPPQRTEREIEQRLDDCPTKPLADASVYARTGEVVAEGVTDRQGRVALSLAFSESTVVFVNGRWVPLPPSPRPKAPAAPAPAGSR